MTWLLAYAVVTLALLGAGYVGYLIMRRLWHQAKAHPTQYKIAAALALGATLSVVVPWLAKLLVYTYIVWYASNHGGM